MVILIMPEAVNMTKAAFKAPEHKLAGTIGRSLGVGQAVIGKPIGAIKGELFGKDALGAPKAGSEWAGKRLGGLGRALTGGGITDKTGTSKTGFLPWQKKIEGGGTTRNLWGKQTKESKELTAKKETEAAEEKLKVTGMHAETQRIRDLGFDPLKHKEIEHEGVTHYQEKKFGGVPNPEAIEAGSSSIPPSAGGGSAATGGGPTDEELRRQAITNVGGSASAGDLEREFERLRNERDNPIA